MVSRDPLVLKIGDFCKTQMFLRHGAKVLLSLSAGKDSMALLAIMRELAPDLNLTLSVFHLNHCMRGGESDADEEFVRYLCARSGIQLFAERADFGESSAAFEERARTHRYELIARIAEKESIDTVMTAHTKSDQIETILMRIFTGTHIAGLAGIPVTRDNIIRPLITVDSAEIVSFLQRHAVGWREDLSNRDTRYSRNFIRHEIIPLIMSRFPRADDTISDLSHAAHESMTLVDMMAEKCGISFQNDNDGAAVLFPDADIPRELFDWAFAKLFSLRGMFVSRERIDEGWKRFQSLSSFFILYEDTKNVMEKDFRDKVYRIRLKSKNNSPHEKCSAGSIDVMNDAVSVQIKDNGGINFSPRVVNFETFQREKGRNGVIFISVHPECIIQFRAFSPGDRIRINGSDKKIKYLMIENHLSPEEKKQIPLFLVNGEVAAIPFSFFKRGFNRVSDDFLVTGASKKILAIYHSHNDNER
ncbi:MAG TPA: tRNA lysidine(34) synthetase TilS [Spirochaetota bacterium]